MRREKFPYAHVSVVPVSKSNNKLQAGPHGTYQLPYPMEHVLEIQAWVELFKPQPLFDKAEAGLSSTTSTISEGQEAKCESCKNINEVGFTGYEEYFTEDEYQRIIKRSRACSLDCAIEYAFRGDFAPSVSEFKQNPNAYKTCGLVDYSFQELQDKYY